MLGQRPWIVHDVEGPVDGEVSQNCTCWNRPPGELMQHVLDEEPWQERVEEEMEQDAGVPAKARGRRGKRRRRDIFVKGLWLVI